MDFNVNILLHNSVIRYFSNVKKENKISGVFSMRRGRPQLPPIPAIVVNDDSDENEDIYAEIGRGDAP